MPTLPTATDAELVARAADGEQAAFTALFERYADPVHDHIARWSRDAELAADATREAFVAMLGSLDALRDGRWTLPWLLHTARDRVIDQLRGTGRDRDDRDARIATAVLAATPTTRATSPEIATATHDTAELVWEVAAGLDDRTFTALDLHVRQGLQPAEVAAVLGITPADGDVLVEQAREHLGTLVGAVLLLQVPTRDCDQLEELRAVAPAPIDLAAAGRIRDHARDCPTCGPRRARAAAPLPVYGALAVVRAPVGVRTAVAAAAGDHFGPPPGVQLRRAAPIAVALVMVVAIAGIASALRTSEPEPDGEPPMAAGQALASPSASPTPQPSPTPTLEALASPSAVPVPPPEPTVEPVSPSPSPSPEPTPSPQPLAVTIDQPAPGEVLAATTQDDQGRQAASVAVAATITGGQDSQGLDVTWTSDRAPDEVLLAAAEGEVLLWLSEACTDTPHTLTVTASDPDTGERTTDSVQVLVTDTCTEPLEVDITEPDDGARRTADRNGDGTHTLTLGFKGRANDEVDWVWTTDRPSDGVLLEQQGGERSEGTAEVVFEDCTLTTSFMLIVEVERTADGSTGRDEIEVNVNCPAG